MAYHPDNPVIIQSDKSVLLEVDNDRYQDARDMLARFAELEKSPEHIHTYRITPLSLWNAAAAGLSADDIVDALHRFTKYDVPGNVTTDIRDYIGRYGRLKLVRARPDHPEEESDHNLFLVSDEPALIAEVVHHKTLKSFIVEQVDGHTLRVNPAQRGHIKLTLVRFGFPAQDLAGYVEGAGLPMHLLSRARSGAPFVLRHYQQEAADIFYAKGQRYGGSGVVVLPCGAGKTMVGMAAMAQMQCATLILTPSTVAARQWRTELLDKTDLHEEDIGEYTGHAKEIRPVTLATYQILTYRRRKGAAFPHFGLFNERNWGLIIYDEVHLLPAPVFRITAEIQARRRLGLTATLVREDGLEEDVFALIGPKKYDVPWKDLERQGWIATAECHEIRIPLCDDLRMVYAVAESREKATIAANNPDKFPVLDTLLEKHREDSVMVIGTYLEQLKQIAKRTHAPLITGKTPVKRREELFRQLRGGEISTLIISKVGNFSIDLPDVNVAIQVSGTFGSRQEEAQRLGRILRPKRNGLIAHFYTLISRDTREQEFAAKRQLFLTEQGYRYEILYEDELDDYEPTLLELVAEERRPYLTAGGS
ncbi:MAG: helicase-associated domain-containing protein [Anaerolineae bacterium]|nr:helicase-associated domain-containing protein [Anaerolineae bacterium]